MRNRFFDPQMIKRCISPRCRIPTQKTGYRDKNGSSLGCFARFMNFGTDSFSSFLLINTSKMRQLLLPVSFGINMK